jgi:hypothetical protein
MCIRGKSAYKPRRATWLAVLIGTLTVAHLWAHATAPYHAHTFPSASSVMSCPYPCPSEHHDEMAHSASFTLPVPACPPIRQAVEMDQLAGDVTPPPLSCVRRPSARAPPRGHRARAVLTHTLEVYRP